MVFLPVEKERAHCGQAKFAKCRSINGEWVDYILLKLVFILCKIAPATLSQTLRLLALKGLVVCTTLRAGADLFHWWG